METGREEGVVLDGRYELGDLIGSGGRAEGGRARDTRLGRDVAIKLISGPASRDESCRRRIEREARALAASTHPNIVEVYDYGEDSETAVDVHPYLVMELVDGPDLHRHLTSRGPMPVHEARDVMLGVLAGVERAHAAGVVHGDLKPANVYMGPHGPKVGDFGVARILDQETGTTTAAATPNFAAPEVLKGSRPSASSDVYSAGCLAFQLLTAKPPFEGANGWEVASKHVDAPVPRVRRHRSDIPADLDSAIAKAMDKDPRRRFNDAKSFRDALATIAVVDAPPAIANIPAPTATVPMQRETEVPSEATTALPRRVKPERVAVFGPLAPVVERLGRIPRDPRLLIALVVILVGIGFLLMRDRAPTVVALPDVRGESVDDAAGALRLEGFKVSGYSYEVVTDNDMVNRVVNTIPAAGEEVAPGSSVHLLAGAVASTPQPVVRSDGGGEDAGGGGGGREARGKRKNDD
ncbi:MAG: protein kinase [Actinomycetota bacterium]